MIVQAMAPADAARAAQETGFKQGVQAMRRTLSTTPVGWALVCWLSWDRVPHDLLLGWLGWSPAIVSVLAAFIIGGFIALILLLLRRTSRSSSIAFGPSMILGAWVALIFPVMLITG